MNIEPGFQKHVLLRAVARGFILFFALVFLVISILWIIEWLGIDILKNFQASASGATELADTTPPQSYSIESDSPSIGAESAISLEISDDQEKVLFEKQGDKKLPIASLTKLMTALVVLETYDLSKEIVVDKPAMSQVGEQGDLKEGQMLSIKNLLYITLIESSNKAAFLLSEVIGEDNFILLMNANAKALGLPNTHFADTTGLDSASYSTTEDVAKLSGYLFFNYPLFREIVSLKEYNLYLPDGSFHHKLINTNQLLGQIDGLVGGKTGWTNIAKGCFMAIEKNKDGNYVIYVVLGAEDRFSAMKNLMSLVSAKYQ